MGETAFAICYTALSALWVAAYAYLRWPKTKPEPWTPPTDLNAEDHAWLRRHLDLASSACGQTSSS